jgi:predicted outer membrane repeat protein
MRPWPLAAAALALLVLEALTGPAHAAAPLERCLEPVDRTLAGKTLKAAFRPSPLPRHDQVLADAREVEWRPRQPRRGLGVARYVVAFNGTGNCWAGGAISGTGRSSRTAPSAIAIGVGYATRDSEVHLLEIGKTLNGLWVGEDAEGLRLENLLLSQITDTCLIADHRGDLIVDRAFFHKCGRVVQLQSQSAGSTLTIRNSLLRINNGRRARYDGRLFNGGALDSPTAVYFEDNVVVTAAALDADSLAAIEANCSGNTLLWLGAGGYPGDLPACFTVVTGKAAWREARVAWLRQHRQALAALVDSIGPGASVCAQPDVPLSIGPRKTVGNGSAASCTAGAVRSALAGGGTISFACGAAPVTIPIASELVVASPTVLDGGGRVTLDGQHRTRLIRNQSQLTLRRITLKRGREPVTWNGSPNGGGAVNTTYGNRLYVVDSSFVNNRTSEQGFGGAIFQAGRGALTVVRSRFENNTGGGGGAIYSLLAGLQVVDSTFLRNEGTSGWQGGGGLMTDGASASSGSGGSGGEITLCGTTFADNQALATGGGAYLYAYGRDRVSVTHSTFTGNAVTANRGGVSSGGGLRLGAAPALVANSTFRHNTARSGGAISTNGQAETRVRNSTFVCNSSDISGGRVVTDGNTSRGC